MSDFSTSRVVKARKTHGCEECGRSIEPGEHYDRHAGVWEGGFYTFVSCRHCVAVRNAIDKIDPDFWEGGLGGVSEWFHQGMLREVAPKFEDGLHLTRLGRQFSRRWRNPDGTLTPVPVSHA